MALRNTLQFISWAALAGTIVPSCLYLAGQMELEMVTKVMLGATIVWFAATPFWMQRESDADSGK